MSIFSNVYVKHVSLALLATVIIVVLIGQALKIYTHHGETVIVPNVVGMTIPEMENNQATREFKHIIVDSVYDMEKKKGSVAYQDPPANSVVKKSRAIYLTLVAMMPEKVMMPDLSDLTLRQASAMVETYGLKIGSFQFVPDIGKNAVVRQKFKGSEIKPGTWIEKGSVIDLVVGKGFGNESMTRDSLNIDNDSI